MSTIEFNMIISEVDNLTRELNRHKDEELSHKDKITVSDLLAETVAMIRRKYELTTVYYLASEIKAADGVGPAGKDDNVEAEWIVETRKADGIFDLYQDFIICSSCHDEHYYGSGGDKPNFCENCGRRMKNGK
ncbi:MAG: hypothetical protein J6P89_00175 [Oscillospiraceae bacterium]|nr:hypothetical protein [Oscillospiraceae bacterium]